MIAGGLTRSPVMHSLDRLLVLVGIAVLGIGALEIGIQADGTIGPKWILVEFVVAGWIYVLAGLVAWRRRPSNAFGAILVAGGLAWLAANAQSIEIPLVSAAGAVVATLPLAVVVHIVHVFPSGQLTSTASRVTVAIGYVVSVVFQAPMYLFTRMPPPFDALYVADRPDIAAAGLTVQRIVGGGVMLATSVILLGRLREARRPQRLVLGPLYAYGVLAVLLVPLLSTVIGPLLHVQPVYVGGFQVLELAGIPIAFTFGMLRGGFARTGEVVELGALLGGADVAGAHLADELAETLGDPSLQLVFCVPDRDSYVDASGADVPTPLPGSGRRVVDVTVGDRVVGAIVYDSTLLGDPTLVEDAARVAAIAVDRERLMAELLASEDALRSSRERLVEAGDHERRRFAGNLHDGLQVQLVVLGIEAQELARTAADPHTQQAAVALRHAIDAAAADLRGLVHAMMPAALVERGLAAAAEDLVDRMPLPVRLDLIGLANPLPQAVQSTAYFVLAEGLTNALKHSAAHELGARLERTGDQLVVEVRDDGVGGAVAAGGGLRGLADRVDVLGGRLHVTSPTGSGTTLVAELPCAS